MNKALLNRWRHLKSIGKKWWLLVYGAWTVFWTVQEIVEKYGNDKAKSVWNTATLHLPAGWRTLVVGFLVITVFLVIEGSYEYHNTLAMIIGHLTWPKDRPILVFESWGEVPHEHPGASPFITHSNEVKYFRKGIVVGNHGLTDAHDIRLKAIEVGSHINTKPDYVSRIDAGKTGFIFVAMDTENNVVFTDNEDLQRTRWDLMGVMEEVQRKKNAISLSHETHYAFVSICYRNADGIWFVSSAHMWHSPDEKRIVFGPMNQEKGGISPPW